MHDTWIYFECTIRYHWNDLNWPFFLEHGCSNRLYKMSIRRNSSQISSRWDTPTFHLAWSRNFCMLVGLRQAQEWDASSRWGEQCKSSMLGVELSWCSNVSISLLFCWLISYSFSSYLRPCSLPRCRRNMFRLAFFTCSKWYDMC